MRLSKVLIDENLKKLRVFGAAVGYIRLGPVIYKLSILILHIRTTG
jgi:hypothetical protein